MSSTSYRVHFKTRPGSPLCRDPESSMLIDRTFPTNLLGHLTFTEERNWNPFCNRMDTILSHLSALQTRNARFSCFILSSFFVMFLLAPILFLKRIELVLNREMAVIAVLVVVMFHVGAVSYLISSAKTRDTRIANQLREICIEFSQGSSTTRTSTDARNANANADAISFLLRRQRVYSYGKSVGNFTYVEVRVGSVRRSRTPDTLVASSSSSSSDASDDDDEEEHQMMVGDYALDETNVTRSL